ncbi:MAG TPA: formate dehydrogenase accessory sulfurtransferase FdhD [Chryseolinea sp.]|nr:formate dehydrogenase accessory sulfurtransferase FdhD [Chryseolinea sp.]
MTTATKYINGLPEKTFEMLAPENALQIKVNGRAYSITMCSPSNNVMLAVGLLYTEGILRKTSDIISVTEESDEQNKQALSVNVNVHTEALEGKNLWNRSIASSASCGVCGTTEICDIYHKSPSLETTEKLDITCVPELLKEMRSRQSTFDETGGTHSAALFGIDGTMLSVQEDIGRHNAVDKTIGELFLSNTLEKADILAVSGRVSYEIVSKCAMANIPFLLAVSAPSSMAVEVCNEKGITLIAFCRENRATVYTNQQHVTSPRSLQVGKANEATA